MTLHAVSRLALLAAVSLMTSPALAGTEVKLPPFSGINVHGGGEVRLIPGPVQRVTVIKGDLAIARVMVVDGILDLSPCDKTCWGSHDLEVEVVSPALQSLDVHGGGTIRAKGNFPKQAHLKADVHGGGDADIMAIPVDTIDANVHGGGDLRVKVTGTLNAEVHGGGDIYYSGHPARIHSSTHGGGEIHGE